MLPTKKQLTKGVTRLTNILPNWPLLVDVDSLDTRYWDTCLLGQIFGHFDIGLVVMRMSYQDAVNEGFVLNIRIDDPRWDELYKQLDELWIEVVEERKR